MRIRNTYLLAVWLMLVGLFVCPKSWAATFQEDITGYVHVMDASLPQAIDLGLPSGTLWADMNVGATSPEDYGDYFAWGETTPKNTFTKDNYAFGTPPSFTKYTVDDNRWRLEQADDAAHATWGGDWRIPSLMEYMELYNYCTWAWTALNGVEGYKLTGKNGNSIFLPAAGSIQEDTHLQADAYVNYWVNSAHEWSFPYVYALGFTATRRYVQAVHRYHGRPIRAVQGEGIPSRVLRLAVNDRTMGYALATGTHAVGFVKTLKAFPEDGYQFIHWGDGNTDNPRTITLTQDTLFTAYFAPLPQAIDLGLPSGTLWADMNVGATSPEDYGDYFAWGEVEPKDTYTWTNYKWGTSNQTLTKYTPQDGLITLEPADDAAQVLWRGDWRMPSKEEMQELLDYCTWTETKCDNIYGYEIKSKSNGKSIFLPRGGYINENGEHKNAIGYYWSATVGTSGAYSIDSNPMKLEDRLRYKGRNIRPVQTPAALDIYHHDDAPNAEACTQVDATTIEQPIRYFRKFSPGKWETLCLPFEVERITVYDSDDGVEYELHAQYVYDGVRQAGDFWLYAFHEDVVGLQEFQPNWHELEATCPAEALPKKNVPYIMMMPAGDYYQDKYVVFHSKREAIALMPFAPVCPTADNQFTYQGNTTLMPQTISHAYLLNTTTDYFVAQETAVLYPFECAVFATQATTRRLPRLSFTAQDDVTTSIPLPNQADGETMLFTITGLYLGIYATESELTERIHALPQGWYIIKRNTAVQKIWRADE